jgi:hypothetical protein
MCTGVTRGATSAEMPTWCRVSLNRAKGACMTESCYGVTDVPAALCHVSTSRVKAGGATQSCQPDWRD